MPACLFPLYRRDSKCVQLQRVLSVLWHNFIDSTGKQRRKQQRQSSSRLRQGTRRRQDEAGGREKEQAARGASQADKQHTRAAAAVAAAAHTVLCLQLLRCLGALPMHSARLFCRLFCARFFSLGSTREREGRGQAWQLAGASSILNFCHFAMSIVVVPPSPPCWQSAPNWLLFNRVATSVSCGLLHILCISCPQIAVHPAPHPLPPPCATLHSCCWPQKPQNPIHYVTVSPATTLPQSPLRSPLLATLLPPPACLPRCLFLQS